MTKMAEGLPGGREQDNNISPSKPSTTKSSHNEPCSFQDSLALKDPAPNNNTQSQDNNNVQKLRAIIEQLTTTLQHSEHANRKLSGENDRLSQTISTLGMENKKQQQIIVELEKKIEPLQLFYSVRRKPAAKFLDLPQELRDQVYDEVARMDCTKSESGFGCKNKALPGYTACRSCAIQHPTWQRPAKNHEVIECLKKTTSLCLVSKQTDADFLARLIPVYHFNLRFDLTQYQLTNYGHRNRRGFYGPENATRRHQMEVSVNQRISCKKKFRTVSLS